MFYIDSKKSDGTYGVIDTKDNIKEFYTEKQLRSFGVDIFGLYDDCIFVSGTPNLISYLCRNGRYKDMIKRMPLYYTFTIRFKSRPTKGEMSFVSNYVIEIRRSDENTYSLFDENRRYRTLDEVSLVNTVSWYFNNNILSDISFKE